MADLLLDHAEFHFFNITQVNFELPCFLNTLCDQCRDNPGILVS